MAAIKSLFRWKSRQSRRIPLLSLYLRSVNSKHAAGYKERVY